MRRYTALGLHPDNIVLTGRESKINLIFKEPDSNNIIEKYVFSFQEENNLCKNYPN